MIDGNKIVGFYTDVFGNEIDEYEQIPRYTVWYEGALYEGDKETGINEHGFDRWQDAIDMYHFYGDMIHIRDNQYDCTFDYGEWH